VIEQSVKQAFGSPGGKSYLAPRIVDMIPPHKTYIEPFAGGAAVYFKKPPSEKEVLSDKDKDIAFAFKFLREMTLEQFKKLKRYDWKKKESLFYKLKASKPKDDVERFRRFYYLKKASFGRGSRSFSPMDRGNTIDISRLPRIKERLRRTVVHSGGALSLIQKYDSPSTFFYLDPPYPDRAFVGATDKYTTEDLVKLVDRLKSIKGKFALSLGTEHAKLLPARWYIKRVRVQRRLLQDKVGRPDEYEIIATNYNPNLIKQNLLELPKTRRVVAKTKKHKRHITPTPALIGVRR